MFETEKNNFFIFFCAFKNKEQKKIEGSKITENLREIF